MPFWAPLGVNLQGMRAVAVVAVCLVSGACRPAKNAEQRPTAASGAIARADRPDDNDEQAGDGDVTTKWVDAGGWEPPAHGDAGAPRDPWRYFRTDAGDPDESMR